MTDTSKREVSAYAKVTVEVDVDLNVSWSGGASINEVHAQAAREAVTILENRLLRDGGPARFINNIRVDRVVISTLERKS